MQIPDASTLLSVWETGASEPLLLKALLLLATAYPERSMEEWTHATVGERDACLLDLRERLFGSTLEMLADCPGCRQTLEVAFKTSDLGAQFSQRASRGRLVRGGFEIEYHLPASDDLLAVAQSDPGSDARPASALLLERCIVSGTRDGAEIAPRALPEEIREAIEAAMAELDPGADLSVMLECAHCGRRWQKVFDIVSHLWSDLEDWAQRSLREVHLLASAYGWSERSILSMSPGRRQIYMEMVAG
jgi:hypothetical protein